MMNGLQGTPLKIDKLGCLGTVEHVVAELLRISKGMENPMVLRLDDNIAVFNVVMPEKIEMPPINALRDIQDDTEKDSWINKSWFNGNQMNILGE